MTESMSASEQNWLKQQIASGKKLSDLLTSLDIEVEDFVKKGSAEEYQKEVVEIAKRRQKILDDKKKKEKQESERAEDKKKLEPKKKEVKKKTK